MGRFVHSIALKICATILITETVLLSLMGMYYINRFWDEIDNSVKEKLEQPAILMEQRALNFNAVTNFSVLEEIIQEQINDAFIIKPDGKIFYSKDSSRSGKPYRLFLDKNDPLKTNSQDISKKYRSPFSSDDGHHYISSLSPLVANNRFLGALHIKINSEEIRKKKNNILFLFLLGSIATILLTTLLEALLVHRLFVPRINRTSSALQKVADGDLTTRITYPGSPDQLGLLIEQINAMIAQIEQNTNNLHLLNKAGEAFAQAPGTERIGEVSIQVLEEHVSRPFTAQEKNNLREIINSFSENVSLESKIAAFIEEKTAGQAHEYSKEFIQTLGRLISSALKREQALKKTSKAEKKYRDLFATAVEGIFRSTIDGRVLMANPAFMAMFGYAPGEEQVPTDGDIISRHYLNREDRLRMLNQLARKGKIHDYEIQLCRKDGTLFWASLSAHSTKDYNGKSPFIDGRIVDISERKLREEAEHAREVAEATGKAQFELLQLLEEKNEKLSKTLAELEITHKKLVRSEKMTAIGMTASGVAHDLNNILSGVINYPELLLLKLPKESEFRQPIEAIMASGKRAAAVVTDLLALSRDTAQTRESVSLNSLIEGFLQSAEFEDIKSTSPDISIATNLDEDLLDITCSVSHMNKLIMNLIINALEAIQTEGRIIITTGNKKRNTAEELPTGLPAGDFVVMKVIDSGPGISVEELKNIFEPFYTKKIMGRSGTGLGLTVVRNVIEEHDGTITVDTSEKGTVFSIYLPATREKHPNKYRHASLDELKGSGSILVVDDEELQRDIATKMLAQLGYTVEAVGSGEEALKYLQENPTDLILLDMIMPPGINGRKTYEKIIEASPDQRAIIVSGFSEDEEVKKAIRLGARRLLQKPYTMEDLGKAVRDGFM